MGVAVPIVTLDEADLPAGVTLVSAEVVREIGRIPHARLVLEGGDEAAGRFAALDTATLVPGAAVTIAVRVDDTTTPLFAGLLVRIRMEASGGVPRLVAECKDRAWALTRPRRSRVFPGAGGDDTTDADAVATILRGTAVTAGDLGGTMSHPELVQWDVSDWDFICARAAANGLGVTVEDGVLSTLPLAVTDAATVSLELGRDAITEVELELDASGQGEGVAALGWDPATGALTEPTHAPAFPLDQGDTDPAKAAEALGLSAATLATIAPLAPDELRAWADGRLARERLALLRGRIRLGGRPVALMARVEIAGVGKRFAGTALVGGVRHLVGGNGWSTDLQLGLPAAPRITDPEPAPLPPARGLSIGLVEASDEEDPSGERRVRVCLPALVASGATDGLLWARLTTPEAGTERGVSFRPRAGDEVVVGFLADDPRQPVILGAMFGARVAPYAPFAAKDAEVARGFGSKVASVEMVEAEDAGTLTLRVGKTSLAIARADGVETLTLADANGNEIVLDKDGIRLTSGKALGIKAATDTKIEAAGLTVDASGAVEIKGASVALG